MVLSKRNVTRLFQGGWTWQGQRGEVGQAPMTLQYLSRAPPSVGGLAYIVNIFAWKCLSNSRSPVPSTTAGYMPLRTTKYDVITFWYITKSRWGKIDWWNKVSCTHVNKLWINFVRHDNPSPNVYLWMTTNIHSFTTITVFLSNVTFPTENIPPTCCSVYYLMACGLKLQNVAIMIITQELSTNCFPLLYLVCLIIIA